MPLRGPDLWRRKIIPCLKQGTWIVILVMACGQGLWKLLLWITTAKDCGFQFQGLCLFDL